MNKAYIGSDGKTYFPCSNCGGREMGAFNWGNGPDVRCFKCPPPPEPEAVPLTQELTIIMNLTARVEWLEKKIQAIGGAFNA